MYRTNIAPAENGGPAVQKYDDTVKGRHQYPPSAVGMRPLKVSFHLAIVNRGSLWVTTSPRLGPIDGRTRSRPLTLVLPESPSSQIKPWSMTTIKGSKVLRQPSNVLVTCAVPKCEQAGSVDTLQAAFLPSESLKNDCGRILLFGSYSASLHSAQSYAWKYIPDCH